MFVYSLEGPPVGDNRITRCYRFMWYSKLISCLIRLEDKRSYDKQFISITGLIQFSLIYKISHILSVT